MAERNVFVLPNMAYGPAIVQAVPTPAIGHICWNVGINLDERRKIIPPNLVDVVTIVLRATERQDGICFWT